MHADLAQRIALVAYGNAFLAGLIESPDLLAENSVFQHVRSIEFRTSGRTVRRVDVWFSALARRRVTRLWVRTDDLAADGDGLQDVWVPSSLLISERFEKRRRDMLESFAKTGGLE